MNIERLSIHNTNKFKYTDTRNDKKKRFRLQPFDSTETEKMKLNHVEKDENTKNIWIWTLMRLFVMHLRCTNWKRNLYVDWFKFHGKHIKHFSVECVECVFAKWQKKMQIKTSTKIRRNLRFDILTLWNTLFICGWGNLLFAYDNLFWLCFMFVVFVIGILCISFHSHISIDKMFRLRCLIDQMKTFQQFRFICLVFFFFFKFYPAIYFQPNFNSLKYAQTVLLLMNIELESSQNL